MMTVKEFAAFTGMSTAKIRAEIREGRLMATMQEKAKVDGKSIPAHYEITEDPAQWLQRRNPSQENQDQSTTPNQQDQEKKSLPPRQKSPSELEGKVSGWAVLGVTLGILGLVGLSLYLSSRNY